MAIFIDEEIDLKTKIMHVANIIICIVCHILCWMFKYIDAVGNLF